MKFIKLFFAIFIIGVIGFFAWNFLSPYSKTNPLDAIPPNAVFIAETNNLFEAWGKLSSNKAWNKLKRQPIFAKLGKGVGMMDTIIQSNRHLSEFIGHRKVYVSVNILDNGKYDLAYIIDLRRISKLLKIKDLVSDFSTSSLKVKKLELGAVDLFEVELKSTQQKFYCYFQNNLFVGSFSKVMLENSLKNPSSQSFGTDPFFTEITDKTSSAGIFRLYINYIKLNSYLKGMLVTVDENTKNFTKSLRYTGLAFDLLPDGTVSCEGLTMLNDSIHSSLQAIINSGTGNSSIEEVLPLKFSSSVSLCFNKFTDYFDNMQESLKQTPYAYDNYQKEISTVEKFLDINVRENFLDWIGEEVAIAQLTPMGLGKNNEFAVFLKTRNTSDAKENLAFIAKKIKNRTPVKIEDVDYKGYNISYLSVKGFFKVFLGKLFQKLETPYYTIVGDYVVLSNHPQVLKVIIDGQADETYLEKQRYFSDFYSRFGRKSNALMLVNTANMLENLKLTLKPASWQQLQQTRDNVLSFPFIGFQMDKDGDYFRTRFYAYYNDENTNEPGTIENKDSSASDSISAGDVSLEVMNWVKNADGIIPIDLKLNTYKDTFPNGQLKVEFEVKAGFKDGNYREYYQNGQLKLKGEYKDDKKEGTWRAYDESGNLIGKLEFEKGNKLSD